MRRICVVLAAALLLASSCYSATVVVRPGDMQGWDIEGNRWGLGYFTTGGPVWDETGQGFPSGDGAFYAITTGGGVSTSDKTPDTVWLGTDTHNGQPLAGIALNRIKTLQYTAYVSDMPTSEPKPGELKYPREPIQLQLVIGDQVGNRRCLWFRPWSNSPQGKGYGGNPADQMARWITYDCINCTPQFAGPLTTIIPLWSEPQGNQVFHSWDEVCAVYGDWTLVNTSTSWDPANGQYKSAGWDNSTTPAGSVSATATGFPLNFEVGARKFQYNGIWGATTTVSWYPESVSFKGYVDTFKLGIDYGTPEAPNVVETTYDFEPAVGAQKPRRVAMNMRSICEGVLNADGSTGNRTGYATIWEVGSIWKLFAPRLVGMQTLNVTQQEEGIYSENGNRVTCVYAEIQDGSQGIPVPITLRVRDADGSLYEKLQWGGEILAVNGDVRRKPWGLIKMRYIWSCAENVTDYGNPFAP